MSFKKILGAAITFVLIAASFVCPVTAQETASELPLLIAPNPNASAQQTEEAAQEAPVAFSDVAEDAPYKDAIAKLVQNGVLSGYPDGTFRPAGNLTRAEMCKMINLTFGYTDIEGAAGFPDLKDGEWYIPYVLAAQKAGYITGDAAGTFRPGDNISRQEVCVILCRIIKPYDLPIPITINDKIDAWARPYVEKIVKNGLMPLEEGGNFRATEAIKRSELASTVAPHSNVKVDDIKCTVTFKYGNEVFTEKVTIGKSLTSLPTPKTSAPEGQMFAGWKEDPEDPVVISVNKVFFSDTVLYASFTAAQYAAKFMAGTTILSERTVKHGEFVSVPASPSLEGYRFEGWALEGSSQVMDLSTYVIVKDTVFVAVFVKEGSGGAGGGTGGGAGGGTGGGAGGGTGGGAGGGTGGGGPVITSYNVVFMSNGQKVSEHKVNKDGFAAVPENPKLEGYEFEGWALSEGGKTIAVGAYSITADTTFYAVFKAKETEKPNDPSLPKTFKVKFMSAGLKVDEQTIEENKFAKAPANPELVKHEFKGWSLSADGDTVAVESYAITADTVFYAVFERIIIKYDVVFIADGEEFDKQDIEENKFAVLPAKPQLEKHMFLGWALEEDGDVVSVDSYAITEDVTFYAVFSRIIAKYDVVFIANGEEVDKQEVEENKFATEPAEAPKLDEYKFVGWALEEDGDIVEVNTYSITEETTFYAVFEYIVPEGNPNDEEVITQLRNATTQIQAYIDTLNPRKDQEKIGILELLRDTITYALEDSEDNIIDAAYVKSHYSSSIDNVKAYVEANGGFASELTSKIEPDTFTILTEFFLTDDELEDLEDAM